MNPLLFQLLARLACSAFVACAALAHASDNPQSPVDFHVANWNVENLFDTADDPQNPYDDEFLPNNVTTRWTQVRFETKLDNLAKVISGMNRGEGPDVLGMEEVENKDVLRLLVAKLDRKPYAIVHADSPDPRGIDVALLYNRDLFYLLEQHLYPVPLKWSRTTRDILHAVLVDHRGKKLHVFVNHWPSRGGGVEASDPNRFAAAKILSRAISGVFRRDPLAHVIVMGDFNDEPNSPSIRVALDVAPYPARNGYLPARLYNLASSMSSKGLGTFFHAFRGQIQWRMYDQIMVSGTLLESARIEYDEGSLKIDRPDYMVEDRGWNKGAPLSTCVDQDEYHGGYSDHLPIGARFVHLSP